MCVDLQIIQWYQSPWREHSADRRLYVSHVELAAISNQTSTAALHHTEVLTAIYTIEEQNMCD